MIPYPDLSPILLSIGPIRIRWYGIMYLLSFTLTYVLMRRLVVSKRFEGLGLKVDDLGDLYFSLILGVIIGGRLGHVLFYNLPYFTQHPLSIFALWEGGMSFHGGLLGVLVAALVFAKRWRIRPLLLLDLLALLAPIGIALGRMGNFINAEIYGRITNVPWCIVFPGVVGCRHPLQLYQLGMEGLSLLIIMALTYRFSDARRVGILSGTFLVGYGIFRSIAELFREAGEVGSLGLTTGHYLSIPMIIVGTWLILRTFQSARKIGIERSAGEESQP